MEPDDIRAFLVPESSWSRAWEPQQRWLSSVLGLCRGDQAIRMGFVLCGWMCKKPQFQLQLNTTSFAPLECHFALNLGNFSQGPCSLVLSPVLVHFRARQEEKAFPARNKV